MQQAGNMLMGSVMYFDNVDVMVILGTSFKYRRNEVVGYLHLTRAFIFIYFMRECSFIFTIC